MMELGRPIFCLIRCYSLILNVIVMKTSSTKIKISKPDTSKVNISEKGTLLVKQLSEQELKASRNSSYPYLVR